MTVSITKLMWQSDLMATRFTLAIAAIMTGLMLVFKPEYWPMDGFVRLEWGNLTRWEIVNQVGTITYEL